MGQQHLADEAIAALDSGDPQALIEFHRLTFGGVVMEAGDDPDDSGDDPDGDDLDPDDDHEGDDGDDEDGEDNDDPDDDEPLGEKGQKALERMKAEKRDLKKAVRDLKAEIESLRNGDDDEGEDELTSARKESEKNLSRALVAEKRLAARAAGLPESWATRLEGEDYDDFLEDAEALAADLPATPRNRKGGGGAKDGQRKRKEPTLDDKIAEAEKAGDLATARRLKAQKVHDLNKG